MSAPAREGRSRLSTIRGRLVLLTVALLAPALLLSGLLLWNVDRQARRALEGQLTETARALSLVVDRHIGQHATLIEALATAPSLKAGDWDAFHAQAAEAVEGREVWITVNDMSGQQLVNTRLPFGAPLPQTRDTVQRWAGARGGAKVSNLIYGKLTRLHLVLVAMPTRLADGRQVQIRVVSRASQFERIFADQSLPETWTGSVVDATGALVARSRDGEMLVGRKASPDMLAALEVSPAGVVKTHTLDGVATYSAFNRMPEYGWAVIVGVPRDELAVAARDSLPWAVMLGLMLLGLGVAAAAWVARGVARPVEALAAAARATGEGRRVAIPPTGMAEVDDLAAAFAEANRTVDAREAELRESEERFRLVAEDAPVMLWMGDEVGKCLYLNKCLREFWGVSDDFGAFTWDSTLLPEDQPALFATFGEAMGRHESFEVEARYYRADREVRTLFTRAVPRRDAEGRFVGMIGVNVDVTDARRAETHQHLLINELNHRVKNTLATVQSIAHQTLKGGEARDARDLLTARLMALSAAHNVLTRESWEGAQLKDVVAEAVRPYDGVTEPRISMKGPALRVGPRVALALSMALHELATNAAKYGALSAEAGKVAIRWKLDAAKKTLELDWCESGGPPVTPPSRKGFGSRLLQQGLATELGGAAELSYEPGGLTCTIRAPLAGRD